MSRLPFWSTCVELTAPIIGFLDDRAYDITFATFARRADWQAWASGLGYEVGSQRGLHIRDDYAVSFEGIRGWDIVVCHWSRIHQVFCTEATGRRLRAAVRGGGHDTGRVSAADAAGDAEEAVQDDTLRFFRCPAH